ncbi:MAG: adenylyl-sulfate kinase [Melioribacteraceae bacterium]|jgi:adenylylsulfate kinase|nr:adenylyl-sulfate kinase [Melioribacteraceae bacterium]
MYRETNLRSIVKTISWRVLATATTIALVYVFIGDVSVALSVGGIEVFLKMLIYFLHERGWDKIKFGRKEIKPIVIWITGLSRSGKSEIGKSLTKLLKEKGHKAEHLDGHIIREVIPGTGHSRLEVNEHIKRVGYLAKKLEEQGVIVVASFLSPYKESREFVSHLVENYKEVYISTPMEVCAARDDKGIYKKALNGEIKDFPGVTVEYEVIENPMLEIDTSNISTNEAAEMILNKIKKDL